MRRSLFMNPTSEECSPLDLGVRPLLDVLALETPSPEEIAKRRGLNQGKGRSDLPLPQVPKTFYLPQAGQLCLGRI